MSTHMSMPQVLFYMIRVEPFTSLAIDLQVCCFTFNFALTTIAHNLLETNARTPCLHVRTACSAERMSIRMFAHMATLLLIGSYRSNNSPTATE